MHQSLSFIACRLNTAQHVSGILMPIIRSLSTAVAASGLTLERGGGSDVGRGRSGPNRPRPTTLLPPRSNSKPEAATAVDELLMMGKRMPETCWAVFKRQTVKLRDWCIWLVDLFEYIRTFSVVLCIFAALSYRRYIDAFCCVRLAIPDATHSVKSPPPFVQCFQPWSVIYCRRLWFVECVTQRVEDDDTSNVPWVLVSCVKINQVEIFNCAFCVNYLRWNENINYEDTLAYVRRSYEVY